MSKLTEIPSWVIEYNNAGHQSSAGKAIKILMQRVKELEEPKESPPQLVGKPDTNYMHVVEMSKEETIKMYMKQPKENLAEMF